VPCQLALVVTCLLHVWVLSWTACDFEFGNSILNAEQGWQRSVRFDLIPVRNRVEIVGPQIGLAIFYRDLDGLPEANWSLEAPAI